MNSSHEQVDNEANDGPSTSKQRSPLEILYDEIPTTSKGVVGNGGFFEKNRMPSKRQATDNKDTQGLAKKSTTSDGDASVENTEPDGIQTPPADDENLWKGFRELSPEELQEELLKLAELQARCEHLRILEQTRRRRRSNTQPK